MLGGMPMRVDPDAALSYLDFVVARHQVWERRQIGAPAPWSDDPVLSRRKFTNVFRVLDAGTQFLLKELIYDDYLYPEAWQEHAFRCVLYRYTNLPEPWEYFYRETYEYPTIGDLYDGTLDEVWGAYRATGRPMFSSAYRFGYIPPGSNRLDVVLGGMRRYFGTALTALDNLGATPAARLDALQTTLPRCKGFIAMQMLTDLGYTPRFAASENEVVVAGPGAAQGLQIVFPGLPEARYPEALRRVAEEWLPTYPGSPQLALPDGSFRHPSLMDVQNTFCEFFKYHREQGRPAAGEYRPKHPGRQDPPFVPPHWYARKEPK